MRAPKTEAEIRAAREAGDVVLREARDREIERLIYRMRNQ